MPSHGQARRLHHLHHARDALDIQAGIKKNHDEKDANGGGGGGGGDGATFVSVVYVSAAKTFAGDAIWVTQGTDPQSIVFTQDAGNNAPPPQTAPAPQNTPQASPADSESAKPTPDPPANAAPTTTSASTTRPARRTEAARPSVSSSSSVADPPQSSSSIVANQAAITTPSQSSATDPATTIVRSDAGHLTVGASAGIAVAAVAGICLIVGLVIFFVSRRKRGSSHLRLADEKSDNLTSLAAPAPPMSEKEMTTATAPSPATVPQFDLRPVTASVPPSSRPPASGFALVSSQTLPQSGKETSPVARVNDPANPFGIHAETLNTAPSTPLSTAPPRRAVVEPTSFSQPPPAPHSANGPLKTDSLSLMSGILPGSVNNSPRIGGNGPAEAGPTVTTASAVPVAAAALAVVGPRREVAQLADSRQMKKVGPTHPKPLSVQSGASIPVAMGSPAHSPDNYGSPENVAARPAAASYMSAEPVSGNVHRVQLEFKPSMEDELDVRAGQLVRLLHEYDDGWTLCVRMDQSQQGVIPRSCLSKYPVKPRGPGPGAGTGPASPARAADQQGRVREGMSSPAPASDSPASSVYPSEQFQTVATPDRQAAPTFIPYKPNSPAQQQPTNSPVLPYAQPQRSMSPGPYGGSYQKPTIAEGRRRSNSHGNIKSLRVVPSPQANVVPVRKPIGGLQ